MNTDQTEVVCKCCGTKNNPQDNIKFVRDADAGFSLCEFCVSTMFTAISEVPKKKKTEEEIAPKSPQVKEIYNFLNKHIISQDEAKKQISIGISQHFKRLKDPSIGKSNILIIGPTGTGKTEMARAVAKFLNIPFVSTDATSLTTRGYIGENTESIVARLLQSCEWNVGKAEKGIIFIDEIDKLASSQNNDSQIGTVAVQQELLKIMEGTTLRIEKSKGRSDSVMINTKNILFICAGSFDGLSKLVKKEEGSKQIGLVPAPKLSVISNESWFDSLETDHLVQYGLIPEFLGRLPIVIPTNPLTKEDMYKIITETEDSITTQYKKLLSLDNIEAEFDQSFLEEVVSESLSKNLGARGIRKVLESRLKDLFFNVENYEGKKIIIGEKIKVIEENIVYPYLMKS